MPEGPEVKLSADNIRPLTVGKRVLNLFPGKNGRYKVDHPVGFQSFLKEIGEKTVRVSHIETKGKFMYWSFDNGYYLFSTFGMSGQWSPKEGKHVCFGFYFGEEPIDIEDIYFNDPRHFGTIKFTNNKQELFNKLNNLGWDPFQDNLENHQQQIITTIQKSRKPIAQLLMDQSIFAGVGNYIKCESLYRSHLSPWRLGNSLSKDDIIFLCQAIDNIMHASYNRQGATILTYKTALGEQGRFSNFFEVYGRQVDLHNNKVVKEITPDKRSTYWCPTIQK